MKNRKQPLIKSFGYAFEGIWTGISKERNMKIHCLAVILVTAVGTFVGLTLVNTAVEAVVDLVTEEQKPLAKIAKDTAAGAVLFTAIMAVIIGCIIFIPHIVELM